MDWKADVGDPDAARAQPDLAASPLDPGTPPAALLPPGYLGPNKEFRFIESAQLPLGPEGGEIDMMMVFIDFLRKAA